MWDFVYWYISNMGDDGIHYIIDLLKHIKNSGVVPDLESIREMQAEIERCKKLGMWDPSEINVEPKVKPSISDKTLEELERELEGLKRPSHTHRGWWTYTVMKRKEDRAAKELAWIKYWTKR